MSVKELVRISVHQQLIDAIEAQGERNNGASSTALGHDSSKVPGSSQKEKVSD